MRRLWKLAAVLMMTAFSLVLAPQSACACSCVGNSEQEHAARADLIFVGVVTSVGGSLFGGMHDVDLAVESVIKGRAGDRVTVRTSNDGASCGYDFVVGDRYKVYSHEGASGLCSGNQTLGAAPEVPVDRAFPYGWVALGGGLVIAGLVAIALRRRRGPQLSA